MKLKINKFNNALAIQATDNDLPTDGSYLVDNVTVTFGELPLFSNTNNTLVLPKTETNKLMVSYYTSNNDRDLAYNKLINIINNLNIKLVENIIPKFSNGNNQCTIKTPKGDVNLSYISASGLIVMDFSLYDDKNLEFTILGSKYNSSRITPVHTLSNNNLDEANKLVKELYTKLIETKSLIKLI